MEVNAPAAPAATAQPAPTATNIAAVAATAPKVAEAPATPKPEGIKPEAAAVPPQDEWLEYVADNKKVRIKKEEALKKLSLHTAAEKRFEEAAGMRKQAQEILGRLKDPKSALELLQDPKLGLDQEQMRTAFEDWYAKRFIEREQMTPEQRKLAEAEDRLKKYEEQEQLRKKQEEEQANQRQTQEVAELIQKEIIQTIEESKLPKTKFTMSRIAYWTRVNEAKGLNAPRELIISQVKKEMRQVMDSLLQSSDGDTLFDLLGDATVKKVRSHDLARIRAARQAASRPVQQEKVEATKEAEPLTEAEVNRRRRELWT